jgi:catechol 2,3-dioxygenase-like lactoylglutathione lyase family enzyme
MADVSIIKTSADAKVTGLTLLAPAANVQRSVNFYELLGMKLRGQLKTSSGDLPRAQVASEQAEWMFARTTEPVVPRQPAGLFYLYPPNLVALRESLISAGVRVSPITYPDSMPKGEVRVEDPDGYTVLIGQAG